MGRLRRRGELGAQGSSGVIEDYLHDLRGRLRIPADRILEEAEDHLRESAAAHGQEAAISRFGPAELVAARFHRADASRQIRRTLCVTVATGIALFVAFA